MPVKYQTRSNQYKHEVPKAFSFPVTSQASTVHLIAQASHIHSQEGRKNKKQVMGYNQKYRSDAYLTSWQGRGGSCICF